MTDLLILNRHSEGLRTRIIESILKMKSGTDKCTPQPDAARAALAHYNKELPWLNLNEGVKDALKGGK